MQGDWDQLSTLDQWLWIVQRELRRDEGEREILDRDVEKIGPGLRELLRRYSEGHAEEDCFGGEPDVSAVEFFESHFEEILRQTPLSVWRELLAALRDDCIPFTKRELHVLDRLSALWGHLEGSRRRGRLDAITPFVEMFSQFLGWEIAKREHTGNETVFWIKAVGARLRLGAVVRLLVTVVQAASGSAEKAARWTSDLLSRPSGFGAGPASLDLNIVVGGGLELSRYKEMGRGSSGLIIFDESVVRELFTSERPVSKAEEIIRRQIGIGRLNPYSPEKPVERREMFFGRRREVRTILDNVTRDFAIVGARRIGKSSLLRYLREIVKASTHRTAIFLDCSATDTPDQLAYQIALQVNPRRADRIRMGHVGQLIRTAYSIRREPFLILLDEADRLINFARQNSDWIVFDTVRSLANEGYAQTVMTGYKVLYEAWQDRATPLFNFINPIYLSVLSTESARALIVDPLRELGVHFSAGALIDQVVDESGCHPSFLQFFCAALVDVLGDRNARVVTATDISMVRQRIEYREFVLKPFRGEGDFSPLERWLVLALANGRQFEFDSRAIMDSLSPREQWLTSVAVEKALLNLELAGLIRPLIEGQLRAREGGGLRYTWTIPGFVRVLELTTDTERQMRDLGKELAGSLLRIS
jgi:hypothetical protein